MMIFAASRSLWCRGGPVRGADILVNPQLSAPVAKKVGVSRARGFSQGPILIGGTLKGSDSGSSCQANLATGTGSTSVKCQPTSARRQVPMKSHMRLIKNADVVQYFFTTQLSDFFQFSPFRLILVRADIATIPGEQLCLADLF